MRNRLKGFAGRTMLAAIDQAAVSAANLGIGLAFIAFSTKAELGLYSMVMAAILLMQSLQNALLLSPLMTVLPSLTDAQRDHAQRRLMPLLLAFPILAAGLLATGMAFFTSSDFGSRADGAAIAAATLGILLREAARNAQYIAGRVKAAMAGSVAFSTSVFAGLAILTSRDAISVPSMLGLSAIGGAASLIVAVFTTPRLRSGLAPSPDNLMSQLIQCSRWATPSVVVSWLLTNAYVYPLGYLMSAMAVGEIAAARLFLVPVTLIAGGWANVFRPKATRLAGSGDAAGVERLAKSSAYYLLAIVACYGVAVEVLLLAGGDWIGNKFQNTTGTVLAWTVYFAVNVVRTVWMATMLTSKEGFKPLHHFGWIALAIFAPLFLVGCSIQPPLALIVISLALPEMVLLALIRLRGWPALAATLVANPQEAK